MPAIYTGPSKNYESIKNDLEWKINYLNENKKEIEKKHTLAEEELSRLESARKNLGENLSNQVEEVYKESISKLVTTPMITGILMYSLPYLSMESYSKISNNNIMQNPDWLTMAVFGGIGLGIIGCVTSLMMYGKFRLNKINRTLEQIKQQNPDYIKEVTEYEDILNNQYRK